MPLPKLYLPPAQAGYVVDPRPDTLMADMGSGPSRFRRDMIGAVSRVNVTWPCSRIQHQYLEAFFGGVVAGSLPFLCDLIIDSPDVSEFEARLVPGSKRLSGVTGNQRVIDAQLEVRPLPRDTAADAAFVELYGLYGDDTAGLLNLLAELVNVTMPGSLV